MDKVLDDGLMAVRAGTETFLGMMTRTRPHWRRLAKALGRRWRQPLWVEDEDTEQELLLAAYKAIWDWQPWRGIPISSYVIYNACDKAKKKGHKTRGAKLCGNSDRNPSRTEVTFSGLASRSAEPDAADRRVELLLRQEATQETDMERVELYDRVLALCRTDRERHVVREAALAGLFEDALALDPEALAECAARIYQDCDVRRECRLGSERQALRVTVVAAAHVAKRFAALAA